VERLKKGQEAVKRKVTTYPIDGKGGNSNYNPLPRTYCSARGEKREKNANAVEKTCVFNEMAVRKEVKFIEKTC